MEEKYENIKKCCESNKVDVYDDVLLDQNSPNPFDKTTSISYFIPERIKNPAMMMITDLNNSKIYFQFDLQNNIPSTVTVDGTLLTTGVYNYSIIADGKVIKSKKMMVIK